MTASAPLRIHHTNHRRHGRRRSAARAGSGSHEMPVQASADDRNGTRRAASRRAPVMLLLGRDDAALIERPTLRAKSATAPGEHQRDLRSLGDERLATDDERPASRGKQDAAPASPARAAAVVVADLVAAQDE
jgi:hypothetical protein